MNGILLPSTFFSGLKFMKIMIVDDNEDARIYLATLVEIKGYETMLASNGQIALEMIEEDLPDLIITDILMPQMDGFELCRQIKANSEWKSISLIIYTGSYTTDVDEQLGLSLGAIKYITKPQEPETLIGIIQQVIEDRKS